MLPRDSELGGIEAALFQADQDESWRREVDMFFLAHSDTIEHLGLTVETEALVSPGSDEDTSAYRAGTWLRNEVVAMNRGEYGPLPNPSTPGDEAWTTAKDYVKGRMDECGHVLGQDEHEVLTQIWQAAHMRATGRTQEDDSWTDWHEARIGHSS